MCPAAHARAQPRQCQPQQRAVAVIVKYLLSQCGQCRQHAHLHSIPTSHAMGLIFLYESNRLGPRAGPHTPHRTRARSHITDSATPQLGISRVRSLPGGYKIHKNSPVAWMQFDFSHMHIIHAPTAPAGRGGPGSGQAHGTPTATRRRTPWPHRTSMGPYQHRATRIRKRRLSPSGLDPRAPTTSETGRVMIKRSRAGHTCTARRGPRVPRRGVKF